MYDFKIQTAQNISINRNLAGVGERIMAFILDRIFLVLFYILIIYLLIKSGVGDMMASWAFISILTLPYLLYYPLFQYWNNGQTFGKQIMKIRIVKTDNSHPKLGDFLIRWIFRIFEVTLIPGIGLLVVIFNEKNQRLGDIVAKTTVVSEKQKVKLEDSIFKNIETEYEPVFKEVEMLKDTDMQLIKNVFDDVKKTGNKDVLKKLCKKIESILHIERPKTMNYVKFVDTIIEDFNYYSRQ